MAQHLKYFITQSAYNVKNAYALKRSFWIGVVSMILNNLTFFIIWFLFMKATGPINGWTSLDVFGMLGVAMLTYGVSHAFFYGIADLPQFVAKGTFDSVLLSPVNAFLKLGGSSFSVTAYGDLMLGTLVSVAYAVLAKFTFSAWALYLCAIVFGCIVFICMHLLSSLTAFFIHDSEGISEQLFEIFLRPALYPGAIFPNKLKIFFMTVIPTLLTSAVPIDAVKLHSVPLVGVGFLIAVAWVSITCVVFRVAVTRYESGNYLR